LLDAEFCTKNTVAVTGSSILSRTFMVCGDKLKTRVAVTSILLGFVYMKKLTMSKMMKNAPVITATLIPYLPRLPTIKIAIALGDSVIETNTSPAPINAINNDKSDKGSNAK
jgi:hypothetical protein